MDGNASIIRKRVIDQQYNGDVKAYGRGMAIKKSKVFKWQDIHAHAVTLCEYEEEALRQIEFQLGHLPERNITLPIEPFVRKAIYDFDFEHQDFNKLCHEVQSVLVLMESRLFELGD